jgi:hypothetical protein
MLNLQTLLLILAPVRPTTTHGFVYEAASGPAEANATMTVKKLVANRWHVLLGERRSLETVKLSPHIFLENKPAQIDSQREWVVMA